jgi:hypothetical protein
MTTGISVSGRGDLDALFQARANAARANVGYQVAGVDIANRFEQIGGGTPIAALGLQSAGVDLASLFRDIAAPAGLVSISDLTCNATIGGTSASSRYFLNLSGDIQATQLGFGNTLQDVGDWVSPKVGMTEYDAMATIVSGTLEFGNAGVWEQLGITNIVYANVQSGVGSSSAIIDVSIRRRSDGVVLDTARIQLPATRSS